MAIEINMQRLKQHQLKLYVSFHGDSGGDSMVLLVPAIEMKQT